MEEMRWFLTCVGFFFSQAEDGMRYLTVTGFQTCALPISSFAASSGEAGEGVRAARASFASRAAGAAAADDALLDLGQMEPPAADSAAEADDFILDQIGRASCRGRVEISVVAGSLKKKRQK